MDKEVQDAVRAAAAKIKVPFCNLMAVIEIESGGVAYATVKVPMQGTKKMPVIRWEGHYFYRRLTGSKLQKAIAQGLAAPTAGAIKNPASQQERWDKLLVPAMMIDANAALESTSAGVGQVMGANWKDLGFASVKAMADRVMSGIDGQIDVMVRFIKANNLVDELQRGDFLGFARAYNGPAQKGYDKKMEALALKYAKTDESVKTDEQIVLENDNTVLRLGASGARVRELQALLLRAGEVVTTDGDFGPATRDAVISFQKKQKLPADGIVGPKTWNALDTYRQTPDEEPGQKPIVELQHTKEAVGGGVVAGISEVGASRFQEVGDKLAASGNETINYIAYFFYALGGLILLASAAWFVYGWVKSKQTTVN